MEVPSGNMNSLDGEKLVCRRRGSPQPLCHDCGIIVYIFSSKISVLLPCFKLILDQNLEISLELGENRAAIHICENVCLIDVLTGNVFKLMLDRKR